MDRYTARKVDLSTSVPGWEVYRDGWFLVDTYPSEDLAVAYVKGANEREWSRKAALGTKVHEMAENG